MSVATIRTAIKTTLEGAGCRNVYAEEPATFDEQDRIYNGRVHYWVVRYQPAAPDEFMGGRELRHAFRIDGWMGVSRDDPMDGVGSDTTFANLVSLVLSTLAAKGNRTPGSSLSSDVPQPGEITRTSVSLGSETVPAHTVRISWTITEDA